MDKINKYKKIVSTDMAVDNAKAWLIRPGVGKLVEVNLEDGSNKVLYRLTNYQGEDYYQSIYKIGDVLVLLPSALEYIGIYHLSSGKVDTFPFLPPKEPLLKYDNKMVFLNCFSDGSDIFICGYTYPGIIKYNVETKQISYLNNWVNLLKGMVKEREYNGYIGYGVLKKNRKAYLPLQCINNLLEVSLDTMDTKLIEIVTPTMGFRNIAADEDSGDIWLEGIDGRIFKLNSEFEVMYELRIIEDNSLLYWGNFWNPIITSKSVLLFPLRADAVYRIDKKTGDVTLLRQFEKISKLNSVFNFHMAKEVDDYIYIIDYDTFNWFKYDKKKDEIVQEVVYNMDEDIVVKDLSEYAKEHILVEEGDMLSTFLEGLR